MKNTEKPLFENVLPEFFDADALRVPQATTYRIDNQGERLYARKVGDEMKIVPSVTTVLRMLPTDHHLIKWYADLGYEEALAHNRRRAFYGTYMHIMFANLLKGQSLVFHSELMEAGFKSFLHDQGEPFDGYDFRKISYDLKSDIYAFLRWVNDYKVKPLAIEYIVFGDKYAGAIDLVCKLTKKSTTTNDTYEDEKMFAFVPSETVIHEREVIAMIDHKSGRKGFHDNNKLQLYALRELWNAERPDMPIEVMANLGMKNYKLPVRGEPYDFKEHPDSRNKKLFAKWPLLVDLYHTETIEVKDRIDFVDGGEVSLKTAEASLITKRNALADIETMLGEI